MPSAKLLQPIDAGVRELRHLDQPTQHRLRDLGATVMPMQCLKRTGQRPFMFNGVTVATVCGVTPLLPFWYELNLHRTVLDHYVTDIRLFHKSSDQSDLFWVEEHGSLDYAIAAIERHEPADDVIPPSASGRATGGAELALRIARLELQVDQATRHYRALAGELLGAVTPREG